MEEEESSIYAYIYIYVLSIPFLIFTKQALLIITKLPEKKQFRAKVRIALDKFLFLLAWTVNEITREEEEEVYGQLINDHASEGLVG